MADFPIPRLLREDNAQNRFTANVIRHAFVTAVDVMLLGCVDQANRIIDLLYEYDQFDGKSSLLRQQLHYAWEASGSWPAAILNDNENKIRQTRAGKGQSTNDGPEAVPEIKAATRRGWSEMLEKDVPEAAWTERDLEKARERAGNPTALQRDGFAPSIEIAFELNQDDLAIGLVRKYLVAWLMDEGRHPYSWASADHMQVLQSPRLWRLLCSGWLRDELNVTTSQTTQFVDESLSWLENRLRNGPARPYRDLSIEQLCHLFNNACLKAKRFGGGDGATMNWLNRSDGEEMPVSFLNDPATEDQIRELEARAKENHYPEGLPEDYKTFLRATNGFYSPEESGSSSDIFSPTDSLTFDGFIDEIALLHHDSLAWMSGMTAIDWPPAEREFLSLGSGGDEGYINVIDRATTQQAIAAFKERYDAASGDARKRIERAVKDVYDSFDQLLELEYVIVRWYHWYPATEGIYPSFRHLLETVVMEAMRLPATEDKNEGGDVKDDSQADENQDGEEEQVVEESQVDRKRTVSPSDPPSEEPPATKRTRTEE